MTTLKLTPSSSLSPSPSPSLAIGIFAIGLIAVLVFGGKVGFLDQGRTHDVLMSILQLAMSLFYLGLWSLMKHWEGWYRLRHGRLLRILSIIALMLATLTHLLLVAFFYLPRIFA